MAAELPLFYGFNIKSNSEVRIYLAELTLWEQYWCSRH